jgi:hypothetical protein
VRDTLSQLQMAYSQLAQGKGGVAGGEPPEGGGGEGGEGGGQEPPGPKPEGAGPAQSSGRLWIPGQ